MLMLQQKNRKNIAASCVVYIVNAKDHFAARLRCQVMRHLCRVGMAKM